MRIRIVKCQNGSSYNRMDLGEDVWAASALAVLENARHDVSIEDHGFYYIDSYAELGQLADALMGEDPDFILFIVRQNTSNPFFSVRYASLLRKRGYSGPLGAWGDTGVELQYLLTNGFDFVVTGEEISLLDCVEALQESSAISALIKQPGVATLSNLGVHHSPVSSSVPLDSLPDLKRYGHCNKLVPPDRRPFYKLNLLASRGCYARCSFCHETARTSLEPKLSWRGQSPERMVGEMKRAYDATGVSEFFFQDSNFFGPGEKGQQRIIEFASLLLAIDDFNPKFIINCRINDINESVFTLLQKAGLAGVFVGIETFSERRLKRYRKGVSPTEVWDALAILDLLKIQTRIGVILFDPDSTMEEVISDLESLKRLNDVFPSLRPNPNFLLNILAPKEGTPLAEELKEATAHPSEVRYEHPEHLRVMQMRFAPKISVIDDPRLSATAEALRLLGYEIMLQWTERQEEIAIAAQGVDEESTQIAIDAFRWTEAVYGFAARIACAIAKRAADTDREHFSGYSFISQCYDYIYRNFLAFNLRYLGERGLYLYTPTTECTPKHLPKWLEHLPKQDWRSWRSGFGEIPGRADFTVGSL